jgi:hypothetical protein
MLWKTSWHKFKGNKQFTHFLQYYIIENKTGDGLITVCKTEKNGTIVCDDTYNKENCICVSQKLSLFSIEVVFNFRFKMDWGKILGSGLKEDKIIGQDSVGSVQLVWVRLGQGWLTHCPWDFFCPKSHLKMPVEFFKIYNAKYKFSFCLEKVCT